jgi:hypothetical protein
MLFLFREEDVDGLFEASSEEVVVTVERHEATRLAEGARKMEAMDGVEEEERTDALVEVIAGTSEGVEMSAFLEEQLRSGVAADRVQCGAAHLGVVGGDDADELGDHRCLFP